jgi:hypothetical protein
MGAGGAPPPRVRREVRSLDARALGALVDAMRVLGNTSLALGQREYGPRFRPLAYLTLKHAAAALHACADQGHRWENQLAFHRALLLEMERSLVAVAARVAPRAALEALPYWDWRLDVRAHGSLVESSTWSLLWGSPFGDPAQRYCVRDPVFQVAVPRAGGAAAAALDAVVREHLPGVALGNGFGFWRSPWSASDCPGLARNPGWALGAPLPAAARLLSAHALERCLVQRDLPSLQRCLQGPGYRPGAAEFGPHNAPHVAMGTFYDDEAYGRRIGGAVGAAGTVGAALAAGVALLAALLAVPRGAVATARPAGRRAALALALAAYALTAAVSLLAGTWLSRSVLGVTGRVELSAWHRAAFAQDAYSFTGALWRQGRLACPAPGSCAGVAGCACELAPAAADAAAGAAAGSGSAGAASAAVAAPAGAAAGGVGRTPSLWQSLAATLAGGPELAAYAESDFWDGAFSSNENFFYPIHALVDLMAFQWAAARPVAPSAANDFLGASRVRAEGCSGTALGDVLSEEFCFTEDDTGLPVARKPGRRRSGQSAADPGQPCLTVEELFAATLPGRAPYTYDVLAEPAVWRAVEPQATCPPAARLCATNSTDVLTGSLECLRRDDASANAACPEPRPSAPSRTCTCADALVRERAAAAQAAARRRLPPAQVWLAAFFGPLLVALPIISCASLRRSERYSALSPTDEGGPECERDDHAEGLELAVANAADAAGAADEAEPEAGVGAAPGDSRQGR